MYLDVTVVNELQVFTIAWRQFDCFYNRFTIASHRTKSGSFTRPNLSQLGAARNTPQYLGWGCSSAGEHFPRTEGVGRSNRLSSTILKKTEYYKCKARVICPGTFCLFWDAHQFSNIQKKNLFSYPPRDGSLSVMILLWYLSIYALFISMKAWFCARITNHLQILWE